jgi:Peptidase inhibitor I78 family
MADVFPPNPDRDLAANVAGCRGMNPDRRVRGSNCFGIFPEQCGADRARAHIGSIASPGLRARIIGYSPGGDVRFIMPGEAVIEDLRQGRLNLLLDAQGTIRSVDCY